MHELRRGIILKDRNVIAKGLSENECHSDLLEELKIEDNYKNSVSLFVKAELIPPNKEWWADVNSWELYIDQNEVPDWFIKNREEYEASFRHDVREWCAEHIYIDRKIDTLNNDYYFLKDCIVNQLSGNVQITCNNSTIWEMNNDSIIQYMYNNSRVVKMYGHSIVKKIDNSEIFNMHDYSKVCVMNTNSVIKEMNNHSNVDYMYDNSVVGYMKDYSVVVKMKDYSRIREMSGSSVVEKLYDNSFIKEMRDFSVVMKRYDGLLDKSIRKDIYINVNDFIKYFLNSETIISILIKDELVTCFDGRVKDLQDNTILRLQVIGADFKYSGFLRYSINEIKNVEEILDDMPNVMIECENRKE